ncbi:MAG: Eco57I restriction-modification methylase domain-containing protein [Candidatus Methanoplasma sp.]|jgi:adenine-specific DNA-methyltransferase|nr:Eco57I restriction-modification methylase domain-containing protein [Candidatus Methanoplasma sp.]
MRLVEMADDGARAHLERASRSERRETGQFFTPPHIARLMAGGLDAGSDSVRILDPGAGAGTLAAAALERIASVGRARSVHADLFETDAGVIPILRENMAAAREAMALSGIDFTFEIAPLDFISGNRAKWSGEEGFEPYDIAISNPPYVKIGAGSEQARAMESVVFGQPNLYCLFMAMASRLLRDGGELSFIVPRSFTSGLYFSRFRKWFLSEMKIRWMHSFESRDSDFASDRVLQETMIVRAAKTGEAPARVAVSESAGVSSPGPVRSMLVDYGVCVSGDGFIFMPTSESDLEAMSLVNGWGGSLRSRGYALRTGGVVEFREREWLREEAGEGTVPLIRARDFKGGRIDAPGPRGGRPGHFERRAETERVMLPRGNYVLVKRFAAKEEARRLQCAMLPESFFDEHGGACAENHVNVLTKIGGGMSEDEMRGLYVLFGSSYADRYYRMLNGSTQVNATEFNSMHAPPAEKIAEFGAASRGYPMLDARACDEIIDESMGGTMPREKKDGVTWENWVKPKIY